MLSRTSTFLLTGALIFATACRDKKDDTPAAADDTGIGAEHARIERMYDDAQSIADGAASGASGAGYRAAAPTGITSGCASVSHDTLSSPRVLTIDFGPANCLCADGVYRRGKILVSYTGRYKDSGHLHTISFDNYFHNDNGVGGTKTVTYAGLNSAGQPYYTISVAGTVALAGGAGTRAWTSTRTRTYTAGWSTPVWADDVLEITGTGSITRPSGAVVAMAITTPLVVALDCKWIKAGMVTITPPGGTVRTLDYGTGACDALAYLTVAGTTYSITLD